MESDDRGEVRTFLFTDIEGSSRLWEEHPERMRLALAFHDDASRSAVQHNRGAVVKPTGDGLHAEFRDPRDAIAAAIDIQLALTNSASTSGLDLRVRCGIHAGTAEGRDGDSFGSSVNRAARIMGAAHGGQILASQAVAELTRDRLPAGALLRDLGTVRLRDLLRPERVFQVAHTALREDFPALRSLDLTPNNIPLQVNSFVGRERDLDEVGKLLEETRLLTLVGVGGLGKTRLALHAAAKVLDHYRDGVWFVELASLSEARLVPQAVASVLRIKEAAGRPLIESLLEYVADLRLLLILDNCEHLGHACAELVKRVLHAGSRLKVLATSREHLHVAGETTYPMAPLTVPDSQKPVTVEALGQYEAARLFIDRAAAAQPAFHATPQNASALANICRQLDGIPLALELAAARVRALSVEKIAALLNDRFRLLTSGDRTELPRHQTMRACLDWSYDLLTEPERALLQRLAVFAGWTLEAAEAVGSDGEIRPSDVPDLLTHLVEKSLVVVEGEGRRYRLLEMVRQYARERLQENGEEASWQDRHLAYFLQLAEEAKGIDWTEPLFQESQNLRAALTWSLNETFGADAALRLCGALYIFWWRWGRATEGRDWCIAALSHSSEADEMRSRVKALHAAGVMHYTIGDLTNAMRSHKEALALNREVGDVSLEGLIQISLANVELSLGHISVAQRLYEESIEIHQKLGNVDREAHALNCLASLFINEANLAGANALLERALVIGRGSASREREAYTISRLGSIAQYQGNYDIAQARHQQALSMACELGVRELESEQMRHLAEVAVEKREFETARTLFRQALTLSREQGSLFAIRECFDAMVALATTMQEYEWAAKFSGIAERMREAPFTPRFQIDQERFQASMTRCRVALGNDACDAAIAAGHAIRAEDALDTALAWL
jgi:predicted ATPase/class 3 adenylate cyclase